MRTAAIGFNFPQFCRRTHPVLRKKDPDFAACFKGPVSTKARRAFVGFVFRLGLVVVRRAWFKPAQSDRLALSAVLVATAVAVVVCPYSVLVPHSSQ